MDKAFQPFDFFHNQGPVVFVYSGAIFDRMVSKWVGRTADPF